MHISFYLRSGFPPEKLPRRDSKAAVCPLIDYNALELKQASQGERPAAVRRTPFAYDSSLVMTANQHKAPEYSIL